MVQVRRFRVEVLHFAYLVRISNTGIGTEIGGVDVGAVADGQLVPRGYLPTHFHGVRVLQFDVVGMGIPLER